MPGLNGVLGILNGLFMEHKGTAKEIQKERYKDIKR
jgi:hypothetical protein